MTQTRAVGSLSLGSAILSQSLGPMLFGPWRFTVHVRLRLTAHSLAHTTHYTAIASPGAIRDGMQAWRSSSATHPS